jgi:hypothetical protein
MSHNREDSKGKKEAALATTITKLKEFVETARSQVKCRVIVLRTIGTLLNGILLLG